MDWTKDNDINFKIIYFLQNKQDLQQLTTIDTKSGKMRKKLIKHAIKSIIKWLCA